MTQVSISFTGLDKVLSMLSPQKVAEAIDAGVQQSAQMLRDKTKSMPPVSGPRDGYGAVGIPVDTGLMRQRIVARKTALFGAAVIAETDYSEAVRAGTPHMPGRDFFLYALEDFGGLQEMQKIMDDALEKGLKS